MSTEDEVTQLREGEEDDEEHNSESSQVLRASSQSGAQLGHRLVEADVLEHLEQREQLLHNSKGTNHGKQLGLRNNVST